MTPGESTSGSRPGDISVACGPRLAIGSPTTALRFARATFRGRHRQPSHRDPTTNPARTDLWYDWPDGDGPPTGKPSRTPAASEGCRPRSHAPPVPLTSIHVPPFPSPHPDRARKGAFLRMSHGRIARASRRYPDARRRAARYGNTRFGRSGRPLPPHLLPALRARQEIEVPGRTGRILSMLGHHRRWSSRSSSW